MTIHTFRNDPDGRNTLIITDTALVAGFAVPETALNATPAAAAIAPASRGKFPDGTQELRKTVQQFE